MLAVVAMVPLARTAATRTFTRFKQSVEAAAPAITKMWGIREEVGEAGSTDLAVQLRRKRVWQAGLGTVTLAVMGRLEVTMREAGVAQAGPAWTAPAQNVATAGLAGLPALLGRSSHTLAAEAGVHTVHTLRVL